MEVNICGRANTLKQLLAAKKRRDLMFSVVQPELVPLLHRRSVKIITVYFGIAKQSILSLLPLIKCRYKELQLCAQSSSASEGEEVRCVCVSGCV